MSTQRQRLVIAGALAGCLTVALVVLLRDVGAGPEPGSSRPPTTPAGAQSPSPTAVPVDPVGAVVGTVTDTGGSPLSGVRVTVLTDPFEPWSTGLGKPLMLPGPTWSGRTDAEGRYRVGEVAPGPHRLVFSAGHRGRATRATLYNGGVAVVEHAPDVVVPRGSEASVDAVLPEAAQITGAVRTARGRAPAPGVPVVVLRRDTSSWTEVATTTTRRGGGYTVGALAPGSYVLRVDDPTSGRVFHPAATRPRAARLVELDEGERVTSVDVALPGPGTVSGQALRPDGSPLAGVWVSLSSGLQPLGPYAGVPLAPQRALTDAAGRYELRTPTGHHEVSLQLEDPPHHCAGVHVQPVSVWVDGGRRTTQDLQMEDPVSIRGTVTDRAGRPLRGIEVVSEQRLTCQVTTRTDRFGRYTLTGLSPGGQRVRFGSPEYNGEYFTSYYGGGGSRDAPVLHLAPGAEAVGVDARLELGGRITGRATLTGGAKALSVRVTATRAYPSTGRWVELSATLAPDGRYEIVGLPTGTYRLSIWPSSASGDDVVEGLYHAGGGTSRNLEDASAIEVTQGRATAGVDLTLDLGATIRGTVVDGAGAPRGRIQVVAYRLDPDSDTGWPESETGWSEASSTWTDASGRYVLRGLGAGSYRVGFGGGHAFFPDATEIDESDDVEVTSGETVRHIDAELVFDWD